MVAPRDSGSPASRRRPRWVWWPGVLGIAIAVIGLGLRSIPPAGPWWLAGAAFSRYLLIGGPVAVGVLLAGRRWIIATLAVAVTLTGVAIELPQYISATPPENSIEITMMTANLQLGQADAASIVDSVRDHGVDILTVQELTPAAAQRLRTAGIGQQLPYTDLAAAADAHGVGLYSRYPITPLALSASLTELTFRVALATLRVPGMRPTTVGALHVAGPWPGPADDWRTDMSRLPALLQTLEAQSAGAVLLGGDFNATVDTAQYRRLLVNGYADAAAQAGNGLAATYPGRRVVSTTGRYRPCLDPARRRHFGEHLDNSGLRPSSPADQDRVPC